MTEPSRMSAAPRSGAALDGLSIPLAPIAGAKPLPDLHLTGTHTGLSVGTLFAEPVLDARLQEVAELASSLGVPLVREPIPAALARGGTVGRIGVPREALQVITTHRVLLGATLRADPLAPVARLFRGLQRRADVLVDVRQCSTLPGSAADAARNERDVLLLSQRTIERGPARATSSLDDTAAHWTRARQAAELAFRIAAAEKRPLLLVLPVGRGTRAQEYFAEAVERQARVQRMPPVRTVKAGLLAALLSGEQGRERWLAASVIPIDELSDLAVEAVGDTGPWPVLSYGREASFYDLCRDAASSDPVPMLLVLVSLLRRAGNAELARALHESLRTTMAARARMQEELGFDLHVPPTEFLRGVLANWGRVPAGGGQRSDVVPVPMVTGLRLRIETALSGAMLRDAVSRVLLPVGLEVASVRAADAAATGDGMTAFDVRVRSRLGEPALGDDAAAALVPAFTGELRCTAIEPLTALDRPRPVGVRTP